MSHALSVQGPGVRYLTQIHDNTLVDLLPQVSSEDLNERDFESGDFSVHEDAREVELDLEADVDIGSVDSRGPPESEATVWDLVQPTALSVSQLLVLHGFLEARRFLPEETLPCREVGTLEECVLKNSLDSAQRLDHVRAVVVEVPKLAIVALVSPPKRILLQHLK